MADNLKLLAELAEPYLSIFSMADELFIDAHGVDAESFKKAVDKHIAVMEGIMGEIDINDPEIMSLVFSL